MAAHPTTGELTRLLAASHRVLVLGGLAVVAHGHSRPTFDADIWLDPFLTAEDWAKALHQLMKAHPALSTVSIGDCQPIPPQDLALVAEEDGAIRMLGANQPLDVFRRPNELPINEFESVWERGEALDDGTRIPDVIDLLVTKQDTGRTKDTQDIAFLEAKAEAEYFAALPLASAEKAAAMLARFLTPKIAELALIHPAQSIQKLGKQFLLELAADGDPFAAEIVKKRELQ